MDPGTPSPSSDAEPSFQNPCVQCGACCASFRVDFAREELLSEGGQVPDGLVDPLTDHTCRMRGTDHAQPRCAALTGRVGENARCGIYEWRPAPCREFGLLAPLGREDDACQKARRRHGLPSLG